MIIKTETHNGITYEARIEFDEDSSIDDMDYSDERRAAWLNDEWHFCGVIVTAETEFGARVVEDYCYALWGIEDDFPDYLDEVATNLITEIRRDRNDPSL